MPILPGANGPSYAVVNGMVCLWPYGVAVLSYYFRVNMGYKLGLTLLVPHLDVYSQN